MKTKPLTCDWPLERGHYDFPRERYWHVRSRYGPLMTDGTCFLCSDCGGYGHVPPARLRRQHNRVTSFVLVLLAKLLTRDWSTRGELCLLCCGRGELLLSRKSTFRSVEEDVR